MLNSNIAPLISIASANDLLMLIDELSPSLRADEPQHQDYLKANDFAVNWHDWLHRSLSVLVKHDMVSMITDPKQGMVYYKAEAKQSTIPKARVFVTTQTLIDGEDTTEIGKWFDLMSYPNMDGFLKDAVEYFKTNHYFEQAPELCFAHSDTNSPLLAGMIKDKSINPTLWDCAMFSTFDLDVMNAYYNCFGVKSPDITSLNRAAKQCFVGYYGGDIEAPSQLKDPNNMDYLSSDDFYFKT